MTEQAKNNRFNILSPDGITIHPTETYGSPEEAEKATRKWIKRYKDQGYYSSAKYGRILYDDIIDYCEIVEPHTFLNKMENVKIIQLSIFLDRIVEEPVGLGALRMRREGRDYHLEVAYSSTYGEPNCGEATEIYCKMEIDTSVCDFCKYDLTTEDLLSDDLVAEFFISSENEEFEVEKMLLIVEVDGERKAIPVTEEK